MADASVLGADTLGVQVQVLSPAPKNPECESVQDFYFLPLHSSLFTKIRVQDFLKVIGKSE